MRKTSRSGYRRTGRRVSPVRGYTLRGRTGRVRYVGVTSNPGRRAAEHQRDGKTGKLRVEKSHSSRAAALRWERQRLAAYRKRHGGKNPPLNKTGSGDWR